MLEEGADVNVIDNYGRIPLHFAAFDGNPRVVKVYADLLLSSCSRCSLQLLLKEDADINAANDDGNTPLHIAASGDDSEIAKVHAD